MRISLFCLAALAMPLIQDPQPQADSVAIAVGKPAPAFRLNDSQGKAVAIGGAAGHWTVLAFYPKAATPG